MLANIDKGRRAAKQRAHTGTHLLHAALQQYFPTTKQEGSFVGEDEIRFDFAADTLLSEKQLQEITTWMNTKIYDALPVETVSMPYAQAVGLGAKAFFADTYGDEVRVISIGNDGNIISRELCGGNHVAYTDHIGAFCIVAHETVASGTKRIVAYTGPRVVEKLTQQDEILREIANQLTLKSIAMIGDKLTKMQSQQDTLQTSYTNLQNTYLQSWLTSLYPAPWGGYTVSLADPALSILSAQDIVQFLKSRLSTSTWVVVDEKSGYIAIYDGATNNAKHLATKWLVQGGGSPSFIQGKIANLPTELVS